MPLFGSVVLLGVGVLYPYADGLKELMMGSDQDDAIMLVAKPHARGISIPNSLTWVIHRVPLLACFLFSYVSIATGWYPLTTPIFFESTIWIISQTDGIQTAARFVAYLSLSLVFWYQLAVGLDLIVMGLLTLLTTILSAMAQNGRDTVLLGILSGVLGATRTVFIFLPFMYAFIVFQRSKRSGMITAIIGTVITSVLHGVFLLWDHSHYTPLHIFEIGQRALAGYWLPFALVILGSVGAYLIFNRSPKAEFAFQVSLLTLGSSLGVLTLASLFTLDFGEFSDWLGANYLMPVIPTLLFYAARKLSDKSETPSVTP